MSVTTAPPTVDGLQQWRQVQAALPVPVLLAPNFHETLRTAVHVLALHDVVRHRRVIVGLDVEPVHITAESCFCAADSTLDKLTFFVERARREQHLYPVPTCIRCLRSCRAMTNLPVNLIKGAPR